ncbi:head maturation protease, ClpP-related [Microbacterium sp. MMO-113]|uniref:head maturation protease, ClpP-related n=1 Tax=Microbacterium sp. MMO-113 TaxID=3081273 RepID=UPI003018B8C0
MTDQRSARNRFWGKLTPPKSKTEFFDAITMPSAGGEGTVATIRMYGPIDSWGGFWGISTKDVAEVLDGLPDSVTQIILRINSPGGEVFEGVSILNMLRAHDAKVTAVVDGLAASAASVIAAGCDETVMSPASQMMIHSPSTIVWGNAADMRKVADVLDTIEESIISIYRDKAGESAWGELLANETWYTAEAAVEAGLADRVAVVKDAGETATAGTDDDGTDPLEGDDVEDMYQSARAHLGLHPIGASAPHKLPSSSEPGNPKEQKEALNMSDAFLAAVRDRLGVTDANASEETVLSALSEALNESADNTTPISATTVAPTIPAGTQLIENSILDSLRADAAAGREAREQQIKDRRDGIIANALQEGRITAASAEHFRTMLDSDEDGTAKVLASMAKNSVPVAEIGHAAGEVSAEDALMARAGWGDDDEEA